jgi:hypothetical protein
MVAGLATCLIAAAVLTSGALAAQPTDVLERAAARHLEGIPTENVDAHQRADTGGLTVAAPPDWFERAASRLIAADSNSLVDAHERTTYGSGSPAAQDPAVASGDEFAWADAALGALVAFAVVLLGGATAIVLRQRKRVALP